MIIKTEFTREDYVLVFLYYDRVFKFLKKELEKIEQSGKKTLWYYSAKHTLESLEKEKGNNLSPADVDNIVYALLNQIKQKQI